MLDWMNPLSFAQTITKILIVWCAFYGAGFLAEKFTGIKKLFPLLPREISGILLLILLEIPLSLFGIMNRTVTPVLLFLFAIPGMLLLLQKVRNIKRSPELSILKIIAAVALLAVVLLNLTYASMPNLTFDDPLITYAVQPDRWLNSGRVYWLEETVFSGFPLTYEMMAVWPASLSSDRLNQLSVLQVFQMTLLFIALFRGMRIIEIKKKFRIPLAVTVLLCSMLYYWCSLAKTDTAAIMFITLSFAAAVRELNDKSLKQYTSWLFMGLALATKQTAVLLLIPFLLYKGYLFFASSAKVKLISLVCISIAPLTFAVRTMVHTGSPVYPVYQVSSLVKEEWKLLPAPEEITLMNDRDSEINNSRNFSVAKHVGIFMTSMEGILLLLLGGLGISFLRKDRSWLLFMPLIVFFITAIVVIWPPWWGVKYSILAYPFVALLAVRIMQSRSMFSSFYLAAVSIVSFVVPGFIFVASLAFPADYRYIVTKSVLTREWDTTSNYRFIISSPEGMTHMWLNSALPEESRILSLHEEKRYFYDNQIFVGWRHPATQPLYLENTLEEECVILDDLGIDYVTFYRANPCIMEMENRLAILDYVGHNDILEPVVSVSGGILVCRYNSPSVSR
ncbi:MAG: hypothetical protein K8S62_03085 [Candidatus Sabulitectum sp.]|nr:hypothetical protein [Candidatus Sabulitectum sp.]